MKPNVPAQSPDEIFDVVDENDRVVGRATRAEVHRRRLLHRAVHIVVSDVVKADAEEAISALKAAGIRRTVMLSGDSERICTDVGTRLGIDDIRYELLPADKTDALERTMADCPRGSTVVYVGDGINDAPSLAMADVGIAMGGLGSDAAIEAADIVIMDDAPSKVPTCIGLSKRVNRIVVQNIVFALGVKFVLLALTLFGYTNMWVAVFGDVGVSIIAILNAMRCMNVSRYQPKEEVPAGVPSEA